MSQLGFGWPLVLALVPVVWALEIGGRALARRGRQSLPLARYGLAGEVARSYPLQRWLTGLPWLLRLLALTLFVVALARPQTTDSTVVSGEGIDILFALDMSGSMNAVDLPEQAIDEHHDRGTEPPNRFESARELLRSFVRARREDRIGLVIFGKDAFLKFPLTLDYQRILDNLDGLRLDDGRRGRSGRCMNECTIDGGGTAIGDALARSYRRLRRSKSKSRVVVLITDGKSEGGRIDPDTMVGELERLPEAEKVQVYTILVGDPALTRMPVIDPFTGQMARDSRGLLRYSTPGRTFPTDPELLERIAEKTAGKHWASPDHKAFKEAFSELERTLFKRDVTVRHREQFAMPAGVGLALLLLGRLLSAVILGRVP